MKIGFVLECQHGGPDEMVYRTFVDRLRDIGEIGDVEFDSSCMGNLPSLTTGCGRAADALLATGCEHVFICWDVYPTHNESAPDCKEQRAGINASLGAANVSLQKVTHICIHRELEAWLIADGRAIEQLCKRRDKDPRVTNQNRPDDYADPKNYLNKVFRTKLGLDKYQPHYHAEAIAKQADLKRCTKSQSFLRLVCKLKRLAPGTVRTTLPGCP